MIVKSFKTFNEDTEISVAARNLVELYEFSQIDSKSLNESLLTEFKMPDISGAMSKAGLHVKKGRGLIQIIAASGIHFAKIFHAAIKVAGGDEKSKEPLKKLLGKKITKEEVIDFLLKLDTLTLHALTGPIHAIEAITGWHIGVAIAKVRDVSKDLSTKGMEIINKLKDIAKDLDTKGKSYIDNVTKSVEKFFLPTIDAEAIKV